MGEAARPDLSPAALGRGPLLKQASVAAPGVVDGLTYGVKASGKNDTVHRTVGGSHQACQREND